MSKTTTQESSVDYLMKELRESQTKSDFMLVFWHHWVDSVTVTSREFQQVFANSAVNKWFLQFIANEEKQFKTLVAGYSELAGQGEEIDILYVRCVSKIMSHFPQALLEAAKKRTEKPKTIKVVGITIELSIINLN